MILDLGLPDMDGQEVLTQLREWLTAPIIVLSARDQEQQKITALDHGADDYLTKPFSTGELLARIRAALRHAARVGGGEPGATTYEIGELEDRSGGAARVHGRQRSASHADRIQAADDARPLGRQSAHASAAVERSLGPAAGRRRRTTCASSWPTCGASSRPTRPSRAICSRSRAWAIGWRASEAWGGGRGVERSDAAIGTARQLSVKFDRPFLNCRNQNGAGARGLLNFDFARRNCDFASGGWGSTSNLIVSQESLVGRSLFVSSVAASRRKRLVFSR